MPASSRSDRPRSPWLFRLADPVLISAGFAASQAAYRVLFPENYARLTPEELAGGFLVSVVTFWAAVGLCERAGEEDSWPLLFQQFCVGTGLSMVAHAIFNYFQLLTRSFFLIVVGGLFAAILLGIAKLWIFPRIQGRAVIPPSGVLIVGSHPMAHALARSLGEPILGAIGSPSYGADSTIPVLGEFCQFEEIVSGRRPTHILMAGEAWTATISPSALWQLRLRGVTVSDISGLYEKMFERVYCRGLYPAEMLLSPALSADSRTMAIQAIYTNLIGLFFLIALSPVLAVTTLAVAFSGPGPILESVECSGFQKISFRLLRFRTRKTDGRGAAARVERIISRLHLVNLPRLINIVRGEMALFGPRPIRREFARQLTEMMPFYSIRFSVKPGLLGWSQAHLAPAVDELREIEYDMYYIKQASPLLDLEILIRMLFRRRKPESPSAEFARSAR